MHRFHSTWAHNGLRQPHHLLAELRKTSDLVSWVERRSANVLKYCILFSLRNCKWNSTQSRNIGWLALGTSRPWCLWIRHCVVIRWSLWHGLNIGGGGRYDSLERRRGNFSVKCLFLCQESVADTWTNNFSVSRTMRSWETASAAFHWLLNGLLDMEFKNSALILCVFFCVTYELKQNYW